MVVKLFLRTGELIALGFYPPHLCLAVCSCLTIFVPGVTLQIGERMDTGAKERKIKLENLGGDI